MKFGKSWVAHDWSSGIGRVPILMAFNEAMLACNSSINVPLLSVMGNANVYRWGSWFLRDEPFPSTRYALR